MPIFIEKPYMIKASKFIARDFEHWEPWMQNAYNKKEWEYLFDSNTGVPNGFAAKGCVIDGGPGDYLVKCPGVPLKVWREKEFEEKFEKMEVIESGRTD